MHLLGALASRRPVGSRKLELAGETPALPRIAPRFKSGLARKSSFRALARRAKISNHGMQLFFSLKISPRNCRASCLRSAPVR